MVTAFNASLSSPSPPAVADEGGHTAETDMQGVGRMTMAIVLVVCLIGTAAVVGAEISAALTLAAAAAAALPRLRVRPLALPSVLVVPNRSLRPLI